MERRDYRSPVRQTRANRARSPGARPDGILLRLSRRAKRHREVERCDERRRERRGERTSFRNTRTGLGEMRGEGSVIRSGFAAGSNDRERPSRGAKVEGRASGHDLLGVALLSSILCIASGCASYDAMPFVDQRSASTLVDHREIDGLHVAVRELSRDRLSEKHFGRELVADGFLPVVVLLEIDAQTNGAYTLRNEDVHLVLPNGERLSPADPSVVASQVSFSHWRSFFAYLF